MVMCDMCHEWYHGHWTSITPERNSPPWECPKYDKQWFSPYVDVHLYLQVKRDEDGVHTDLGLLHCTIPIPGRLPSLTDALYCYNAMHTLTSHHAHTGHVDLVSL